MKAENPAMVFGEIASPGVARGIAIVCACTEDTPIARHVIDASEVSNELARFDAAVVVAEKRMRELQQKIVRGHSKDEAEILDAHISLLHDPSLRETVCALCTTSKLNIEAALSEAINTLTTVFARLANPYFKERAADLVDIGNHLQQALAKDDLPKNPSFPDGTVLVTRELLPSVLVQLDEKAVCAVIVEQGGQTAHATILARARSMPMLIHVEDATKTIHNGDPLIVDGLAGRIFINAPPDIQHEYDRLEADLQAHKTVLQELINQPAETLDGVPIKLSANIGKVADAATAATVNADGAGLYRTEFVFLAQNNFPSEEDQYNMYRGAADRLQPREVVIRVIDIGSDKLLSYFPLALEANPSLGSRGIRLLLAHPEIFHVQLRAILRLSATHAVSLLLPMVGGVEDLRRAKEAIEHAKATLTNENLPFNPNLQIGAMIETPASVILADRLIKEVDFLSIGTNDLVQYLLTTDRTSNVMSAYYEPLHPAVLAALASVASVGRKSNKRVSICGEMAGNPAYTTLLLGLGFRNLSVNLSELLEIKNAIRSTSLRQAERLAKHVLELSTIQEIKDCLHDAAKQ